MSNAESAGASGMEWLNSKLSGRTTPGRTILGGRTPTSHGSVAGAGALPRVRRCHRPQEPAAAAPQSVRRYGREAAEEVEPGKAFGWPFVGCARLCEWLGEEWSVGKADFLISFGSGSGDAQPEVVVRIRTCPLYESPAHPWVGVPTRLYSPSHGRSRTSSFLITST